MLNHIIIAGSGGQGIQFAGQLLARAAVNQGLEAAYVPAYGAERRGGPSFCYVTLSNAPIDSPLYAWADTLWVFDQRARAQYAGKVRPEGLLLVENDLAPKPEAQEPRRVIAISALREAEKLGLPHAMNLIFVGAFLSYFNAISLAMAEESLRQGKTAKLAQLENNITALRAGFQLGKVAVA
jgi:2-oxoglutarate ferredoxin oxidoreductase subunit gamma